MTQPSVKKYQTVAAVGNIHEVISQVVTKLAGSEVASNSPEHVSNDITAALANALKKRGAL